jgi:hypothetical protein
MARRQLQLAGDTQIDLLQQIGGGVAANGPVRQKAPQFVLVA